MSIFIEIKLCVRDTIKE